ncbi:MAG TPA: mechanosensitive ion channel family protein [Oscillatoriaceae cyanobacterium]
MSSTPLVSPTLAPAVRDLLDGQVSWNAQMWHQVLSWLFSSGLSVLLVIGLTLFAMRAYAVGLNQLFKLINANLSPEAMPRVGQRTKTLSSILRSLGDTLIAFMGVVMVLAKLGVNVAPILASAGILGLAVGFGAQSLVKDVISGFFILIEDQYGVGDVIEVNNNGKGGEVERMNLRITQLRNLDGQLITIPNGTIQMVVNFSKEWSRSVVDISVAYRHDPDHVMTVLREVADQLASDMADKILPPPEVNGINKFGDSSIGYQILFKTRPLAQWTVAREFRRRVWHRFQQEGIELPFPQHTLWMGEVGDKPTEMLLNAKEGSA